MLSGAAYKGQYYESLREVSSAVLTDAFGAAGSDINKKKQVALNWVLNVCQAWSGSPLQRGFVEDCKFDLGPTFSYTFPEPSASLNDDGSIDVCYWVQSGGGMRPEWRYYEKFMRFYDGGVIADEGMRHQLVRGADRSLKIVRIGKYGTPVNSDSDS